ncbi:MAG: MotA/TolQ/ExbB proton channel family protein [Pseudomonadota bacterium]|nr:MotA/TolQ/ExbB proton channel family protein [Pseudomonadota bacterium]
MSEFANYIDKGGFIFILLLTMSAIGLTIILYKFFELYFIKKNSFKKIDFSLKNCSSILEFDQKLENSSENTFLKEIIHVLNKKNTESFKNDQIQVLLEKEIQKLQKFMPTLEIIAQVSPLIGLLGTVIGMIDSFNELELGGSLVDPSILAGGIWTALLTTAMGLIVAIPALISHYFFDRKILQKYKNTEEIIHKLISIT